MNGFELLFEGNSESTLLPNCGSCPLKKMREVYNFLYTVGTLKL